jgi:4-amino-4-deoxy-L-arabinose transferase-like glycosyltransferase
MFESSRDRVDIRSDIFWLAVAALVLVATGLGFRDPWPADEPRFALVARDMVLNGDWLFPRVGGDLYHDKPPLFFWLLATGYFLTGSVRASFLIPSFLAACGTLVLVYDLARRLASREAALAAAALLACTIQFLMVMRGAQIDATLCFLTTLSLYGLLRHLLLGPAWNWYFVGGLAAGLGVITKGVGFLPLLVLLPYPLLRAKGFQPLPRFNGGGRWALVAVGFLLGVAVWLVPMLLAVSRHPTPELIAYRDGILFQQTVQRYASAWHHVQPWYYFLIEVIPALWLPASLLLFWLLPRWKAALRERAASIWLPLAWALLTILFFSASTGKRGIYIFPALPAFIWAAAPYLPELLRRRGVRVASLVLAAVLIAGAAAFIALDLSGNNGVAKQLAELGFDPKVPVGLFVAVATVVWLLAWRRQPLLAWPGVLACLAIVWSYGITPKIDAQRSGRAFITQALEHVSRGRELGLAGAKEQFFLYLDRPVVNFGHARWTEKQREAEDAARWLNGAPGRVLLMPQSLLELCFTRSPQRPVGESSREKWSLVELPADPECASRGDPNHVIRYIAGS